MRAATSDCCVQGVSVRVEIRCSNHRGWRCLVCRTHNQSAGTRRLRVHDGKHVGGDSGVTGRLFLLERCPTQEVPWNGKLGGHGVEGWRRFASKILRWVRTQLITTTISVINYGSLFPVIKNKSASLKESVATSWTREASIGTFLTWSQEFGMDVRTWVFGHLILWGQWKVIPLLLFLRLLLLQKVL